MLVHELWGRASMPPFGCMHVDYRFEEHLMRGPFRQLFHASVAQRRCSNASGHCLAHLVNRCCHLPVSTLLVLCHILRAPMHTAALHWR
jgi:hypothetical protein